MPKNKCFFCNKKIGMMGFDCKCNKVFCIKCRYPEVHNCTFNHKDNERDILKNKLIKVVGEKVEKI